MQSRRAMGGGGGCGAGGAGGGNGGRGTVGKRGARFADEQGGKEGEEGAYEDASRPNGLQLTRKHQEELAAVKIQTRVRGVQVRARAKQHQHLTKRAAGRGVSFWGAVEGGGEEEEEVDVPNSGGLAAKVKFAGEGGGGGEAHDRRCGKRGLGVSSLWRCVFVCVCVWLCV
jgi:hypothetical protein